MSSTSTTLKAPIARREEDRVQYAGAAPEGWRKEVPRQAEGSTEKLMDPPVAVPDPYGWLRDDNRKNEEILAHLKAENEYSQGMTKHLEGLRKTLYDELLSTIQETDYSVPRPHGDYYRYSRTFEGKAYAMYCRAPKDTAGKSLKIEWDWQSRVSNFARRRNPPRCQCLGGRKGLLCFRRFGIVTVQKTLGVFRGL